MSKLVVFDLDFTLWDAGGTWCDCTNPPYKLVEGYVQDVYGRKIKLYPDVKNILKELHHSDVKMALASRTEAPPWARELLSLFDIAHYFEHQEIYPGSKVSHFRRLNKVTGIPFEKMVFFDDEMRNIREVGAMGVHAVYVEDGVNYKIVSESFRKI